MSRYGKDKIQHDEQVCRIARELSLQGYQVNADAQCPSESYSQPREYGQPRGLSGCDDAHSRRPDINAVRVASEELIIEVETEQSLDDDRTRCQMKVFSAQPGTTIVYVPRNQRNKMENNLRTWGLTPVEDVEIREYD